MIRKAQFKKLLLWSENNKLLVLNSVVVILIGLITLMVQYSESKINDHQNELLLIQNQTNNLLITKIDLLAQGNLSQLYSLLGAQSGKVAGLESPYADPRLVALGLEFQSGRISAHAFLRERTEIYYSKANETRNQYNEKALDLSERIKKGTFWEVVSIISYTLLLLLVMASGILNVLLYRRK